MFLSESRPTVLTGCHDAARGIVQCNGIPQPNASNSRETLALTANIDVTYQGRPQDLGGGGQEFFFLDLGICMSQSDMLRMAKPCAVLGGFGGMLPREIFLKRCNLVRFRVYFDQILSLFFSKKCHFLYKK